MKFMLKALVFVGSVLLVFGSHGVQTLIDNPLEFAFWVIVLTTSGIFLFNKWILKGPKSGAEK